MARTARLTCAALAVVIALVGASPAVAARGGMDGLKFSVEVLAS